LTKVCAGWSGFSRASKPPLSPERRVLLSRSIPRPDPQAVHRQPQPEPFRIEPTFSPRIWGARSLAPLFPEKTNLTEPIGEAWLTDVNCRVATGPFAGKTLGEAWREMPAEWRGSRFAEPGDFPLLVKFIFPTDKLSIQVHPDDAYASVHEKAAGGRGKTEMWHAVSAEPGAKVLVGLKPGVTKEKFLEALANQTLEDCFVPHDVHAGDTFFIPAGTPHTIGPGMILCEVQQYSDLTYRVYDYGRVDAHGRPRELQIEKALDVMNFTIQGGARTRPLSLHAGDRREAGGKRILLSACQYFAAERWELYDKVLTYQTLGLQFEIHVVLAGSGQYAWDARRSDFHAGECWFIPACHRPVPSGLGLATILRAYVPDIARLRSELKVEGLSEETITETVVE
jgi:mannose-6-phosphate isomerase